MTSSDSRRLVVETSNGPVAGFIDTFSLGDVSRGRDIVENGVDGGQAGVKKWLGIPYAQAERWTRPRAPDAWTEVKDALGFGTKFPQPEGHSERIYSSQPGVFLRKHLGFSEHGSHNVNVFAPSSAQPGDNLPVLVWIYGGSLNNGSADRFWYDPTEWIRAREAEGQRFIVVSGEYRTNIFGFFSGIDLLEADPDGLCGNYGLRDCLAMLEWVQANIHQFGGSRDNVTLFGQSAGAFLTSNLLVSGRKLFRRAIQHSGAAGTMGIKPVGEAYPAYSHIINSHGPSAATSEARIRALRSVPAEDLLQSHNETNRFGGINLTIEQGSGAIWTEATLDRLRRGEHDPWIEAVILGTTEDEGTMFTLGMRLNTPQGFDGYTKNLPEALQSRVRERYLGGQPHPETVSLIDAPATKLLSDQLFTDPVYNQALAMASQPNKCRTWVYRCRATVDRISKNDVAECGAMHCIELPFVFNTASLWDGKADAHEAKSAAVFGSTWARFAIGGNPDPNWQPFDPNSPSWFVFESGGQTDNESLESYAASRIDFSKRSDGEDEGGDTLGETNE